MKAKIEFNLDDPDDIFQFNVHNKAQDMALVLWDIDQWLRSEIKYKDKPYDEVREELSNIMDDREINLDTIMR